MGAVETGKGEECCAEQVGIDLQPFGPEGVELVHLEADEYRTHKRGGQQPQLDSLLVVPVGCTTVIEGQVPQSEVMTYATTLRSQTQGLGSFTMEFEHYEEVPANLVDRLVQTLNVSKEKQEAGV